MEVIEKKASGTSGVIMIEFVWNKRLAETNNDTINALVLLIYFLTKIYSKHGNSVINKTEPKRTVKLDSENWVKIQIIKATTGPWSIYPHDKCLAYIA